MENKGSCRFFYFRHKNNEALERVPNPIFPKKEVPLEMKMEKKDGFNDISLVNLEAQIERLGWPHCAFTNQVKYY